MLFKDRMTFGRWKSGEYWCCLWDLWPFNDEQILIGNFLFGAVKLTENIDPCKYNYSVYGIGFDASVMQVFCYLMVVG